MDSSPDLATLHAVPQRPVRSDLEGLPTDAEIIKTTRKAKKDRSPGDNKIPAELWCALVGTNKELETAEGAEAFDIWRAVVHEFWEHGSCGEDWLQGRLKMLFKKGARANLNNWRGVMLLDAACKIVSAILASRLTTLLTQGGSVEEQNGFLPDRGCTDAVFALKVMLQKRKEHGLDTHVVFIDLVKAFDSVSREGLYLMLGKIGVPESLIHLVISLHTNFSVKVKAGQEDVEVPYNTGVKQGDSLAPILFLAYFELAMESLHARWEVEKPAFLYKLDTVTGGRRWGEGGGTLMELYRSFYADDGAFAFTKRHDAEIMVPVIFDALKDFGLTMHVQGKTEAVFFPSAASAANPDDGNTADLIVGGGKVGYKPSFIYLGSSIHASEALHGVHRARVI